MDAPKRGRPPLTPGDRPARVTLLVPSAAYDRAYELAKHEGISVPELLRRGLARTLDEPDD